MGNVVNTGRTVVEVTEKSFAGKQKDTHGRTTHVPPVETEKWNLTSYHLPTVTDLPWGTATNASDWHTALVALSSY